MLRVHRVFGSIASVLLLGASASCGNGAASEQGVPTTVAQVLSQRCASCHGAPPSGGAPMALRTHADMTRPAVTTSARPVWELMRERVNGNVLGDNGVPRFMPPSGPLPAAELATLNDWFTMGAPAGPTLVEPPSMQPMVGPQALPCPASEQRTFRAHAAGSTSAFHVPVDAGNLNMCFTFRSPFTSPTQATAFAPIIDDARVLHHWILFQTAVPQTDGGAGPCRMPPDASFVTGWAPGATNTVLPQDVGVEMPRDGQGWFILQVHYWNVSGISDANDASGMAMCTTNTFRAHNAAVSTLGSLDIAIPARAVGHEVVGNCTPELTEPVHVIGAGPHMHRNGASFRTEVFRGGNTSTSTMMVDVPRWDFEGQTSYPTELVINPGDTLRTTCRYNNNTNETIYFGERTEDEMCFNFVLAWPAGALANAGGRTARRCIDPPR